MPAPFLSPVDSVAVIFASQRRSDGHGRWAEEVAYCTASDAMDQLARAQPGFAGVVATRGLDGFGITVSYWVDDAAAKAWRDHFDHARIRDLGRHRWYDWYSVTVARVERGYDWANQ